MNSAPGSIARRFPTYWFDGEGGIDWNPGTNNPIVALADGDIIGAGYFCKATRNFFMPSPYPCSLVDYGVITTQVTDNKGKKTNLYYQHILIDSHVRLTNRGSVGQKVKKGDIIGRTNPGGFIEMGVNVSDAWQGIWGPPPAPGPHVDPEVYLRALISAYGTANTSGVSLSGLTTGTPVGTGLLSGTVTFIPGAIISSGTKVFNDIASTTHQTLNTVPGFTGIVDAIDQIEQFQPFTLPATVTGAPDWSILGLAITNPIAAISNVVLPADNIQAFLMFVTGNIAAAFIRLILIIVGLIIIIGLIQNAIGSKISASDVIGLASM